MLGVCFRSEHRGWMQEQWSWVFSNFGVTEIWERGAKHEGLRGKDGSIYQTTLPVESASELPVERPLIVIAPPDAKYIKGTINLMQFDHPENPIYLFGGSQDVLSDESDMGGRTDYTAVYIPLVKHECYSHSAAYMVLWDRYVKRGDFG